jgi:lantibiotic modifying enzyme
VYVSLLTRALQPRCLRDGADFGIELDVLSRPLLRGREAPLLWPLLAVERRSLERLDVPCFTASSDSDGLAIGPDQIVPGLFTSAGFDGVLRRLGELDEDDLSRQVEQIRESLATVVSADCAQAEPGP